MTTKHALKTALTALAITATLGLAGCGTDETKQPGGIGVDHSSPSAPSSSPTASSSASVSTQFNDADVTFVQMMLPHHEQAVAMSDTLLKKTGVNAEVTALAQQVKAAQQPEIDTMKSWLAAWGEDEMADDGMDSGMGHSGGGMASDAELEEFEQADGAAGQKMYLEMMTAHHEGAIEMAEAEVSDGENPDAVRLAKQIITTQQQEITVMEDLLAKL
jgi:uncharacterized protein (DUF305 family)